MPNPREVRFGEGAIWVTSAGHRHGVEDRPSSRTVEGRSKVGPSTYGLSVGGGFVWATSPDGGDLTRIDPDASVAA